MLKNPILLLNHYYLEQEVNAKNRLILQDLLFPPQVLLSNELNLMSMLVAYHLRANPSFDQSGQQLFY